MNLLKIRQLNESRLLRLKHATLRLKKLRSLFKHTLKINVSLYELSLKFLNSKLNMRFYNNLDKEAEDFKELKDGQRTLHIIKYSHYQKDRDIIYI